MRRFHCRSRALALVGAILVTGVGTALAAPASASAAPSEGPSAYKYWGYYHATDGGDWTFSTVGAQDYVPKDGSLEGWRYGLDTTGKRPPRVAPEFAGICGDDTPSAGNKLVAVVVDYGTQSEAEGDDQTPPARGACADVPADASGQQVLQSVAKVTLDGGLVAAVDGYPSVPTGKTFDSAQIPASEPTVALASDNNQASSSADESDDGLPWPVIGAGIVVVALASGAFARTVRRRS